MVTHPFHPLAGRRLQVVFARRRWCGQGIEYVCELGGTWRMAIRQEWTDRGLPAAQARVSLEGLTTLRGLLDALSDNCLIHAEEGKRP